MLPVSDPRHDELIQIGENLVERFSLLRRLFGQRFGHLSWFDSREDRPLLDTSQIIDHPVDGLMTTTAQFFSIPVQLFRSISH